MLGKTKVIHYSALIKRLEELLKDPGSDDQYEQGVIQGHFEAIELLLEEIRSLKED